MKTAGIIANPSKEGIEDAVRLVDGWCGRHGVSLIVEDRIAHLSPEGAGRAPSEDVARRCELIFAFGGDGTLLAAARRVAAADGDTPILGVNMGSLGFLTQVAAGEFPAVLARLDPGHLPVTKRMMLEARVGGGDEPRLALNDVVIAKGAEARMLTFEARVDGELVTRYAADGLILSTPTGSTAHSLSAGGPVVMPNVEAIIATPICPHTLSVRSCVVPPSAIVEVEMLDCDEPAAVTTDGEGALTLNSGETLVVRTATTRANLVDVSGHSYYEILRTKMRWAGRVRER